MHDEDEEIDVTKLTELFGFETLILKSVGITIGSSTSHLMFSELTAKRRDSRISKYEIADRAVTHRSPIIFTPYVDGAKIDTIALHDFIMRAYREAGITPQAVDTGAVIITGYAALKENSEAIVDLFSRWAGKFVCATAGPKLEAMLAAHGSGAVSYAKEYNKTVMNVDIGGGTSKIVIIKGGEVVDIASLYVGSRVIAVDPAGRITRIEEAGRLAAREIGIDLRLGVTLSVGEMNAVAGILANSLLELCTGKTLSSFTEKLLETAPLHSRDPIDTIMFSGGVAEYIYDHEKADFGDLGPYLSEQIKQSMIDGAPGIPLREPTERIRATVMGASQYSLQISGNTIFLSPNAILPKRNLQVLKVRIEGEAPTEQEVENAVREALSRHDIDTLQTELPLALTIALPLGSTPSPVLLRGLSQGIVSVWQDGMAEMRTLILILDIDIAHLMGTTLSEKLGPSYEILCLDGIEVGELDYIDIGAEIEFSRTIPVVVKNLVFSNEEG